MSCESSCAVRLARHSQNAWARHVECVESSRVESSQVEFELYSLQPPFSNHVSASEMTCIVSSGALNSTHSLSNHVVMTFVEILLQIHSDIWMRHILISRINKNGAVLNGREYSLSVGWRVGVFHMMFIFYLHVRFLIHPQRCKSRTRENSLMKPCTDSASHLVASSLRLPVSDILNIVVHPKYCRPPNAYSAIQTNTVDALLSLWAVCYICNSLYTCSHSVQTFPPPKWPILCRVGR